MNAPKVKLRLTPANSRTVVGNSPRRPANPITIAVATRDPASDAAGTVSSPSKPTAAGIGMRSAKKAAKVAPDEIPKV